jgi:very-short-patch-repair endonuclease
MENPRTRSEEAAARQHGVITRAQALELGLSARSIDRLVKAGAWHRVHTATYVVAGAPATWLQAVAAAVLSGAPDAVASHRTAARLWDCPDISPAVEITTTRALRRQGVEVHRTTRLGAHEVRHRGSIPVTDPERTLVDLSAVASREVAEAALDHLLAQRFTTVERIKGRVAELDGPGWRGTKHLKALLVERSRGDGSAESMLETKLYRLLRSARLPLPQRQVSIYDGRRLIGRVDLAYPHARLILEAQSYRHHSSRRAWTKDVRRRRDLHLLGWRVVEVTWYDVTAGRAEFIEKMRRLLGEMSLL